MCCLCLIVTKHILVTYVIMFVWGVIASGNYMVSGVFTTETCPWEWQTF